MLCEVPEFGRCCCCLPLRYGILLFGYINILFSMLMVGVYSYSVYHDVGLTLLYHGAVSKFEDKICLVFYCADIIFNGVLVFGGHMKHILCLKTFYYYALSTSFAIVLIELLASMNESAQLWELIPLFLVGLCLNLYLLFMVKSLLKKLETSGRTFENQLHQYVNGEIKTHGNGVYPPTVVPNDYV